MSKVVLSGWEEEDPRINLLLISTHLEDYRLAYFINKLDNYNFINVSSKKGVVLDSDKSTGLFNIYQNKPNKKHESTYLVENQISISSNGVRYNSLFDQKLHHSKPLIKTCSKWAYFIISIEEYTTLKLKEFKKIVDINALQTFDFQRLNKSEQHILNNIFYEN